MTTLPRDREVAGDRNPLRRMYAPLRRGHVCAMVLSIVTLCGMAYGITAYEFVPGIWRFVERRHPALDEAGTRAFTSAHIPGDPLNVAFIGDEAALRRAMAAGHWIDADPITLRSSMRIVVDSAAHRSYMAAPVSNLYVNGRRQDLAFEAPVGRDPSQRHHVRFWKMARRDLLGRTLWIGAATYDRGVGLSHTTGQITHHIDADVDRERDKLVSDVAALGGIAVRWIDGFQQQPEGHNGGGDRFFTDERLAVIEMEGGSIP